MATTVERRAAPDLARHVLQRSRRVRHADQHRPVAAAVGRDARRQHVHERSGRAVRQRVGDEAMPVEPLAANGDEEVARGQPARVDRDRIDRLVRVPLQDLASGCRRHLARRQRDRVHHGL